MKQSDLDRFTEEYISSLEEKVKAYREAVRDAGVAANSFDAVGMWHGATAVVDKMKKVEPEVWGAANR